KMECYGVLEPVEICLRLFCRIGTFCVCLEIILRLPKEYNVYYLDTPIPLFNAFNSYKPISSGILKIPKNMILFSERFSNERLYSEHPYNTAIATFAAATFGVIHVSDAHNAIMNIINASGERVNIPEVKL